MSKSWAETELWEALQKDTSEEGKAVSAALRPLMDEVEAILESGIPIVNFTLHDAGHSFRVAQRMVEVVPADVFGRLSVYEYALLLLAAYLHDIGMTPEAGRMQAHRDFLSGVDDAISENERKDLVAWLDAAGIDERAELSTADVNRILESYVRACHVDWGEDWTRRRIEELKLGKYRGWQLDLYALCRSHQEGFDYLGSDSLKPRNVGDGEVVHLRYLALVLRMADVLEFDPERTPEAVFRHRAIEEGSKIFWHKDHEIALKIEDATRLMVTARPPSAVIHKAVEETANQVDVELALCRQVADTYHLEVQPGAHTPLPHRWDLLPRSWREITPAAGAYDYIDGAFRPNTDRVLELVAGTALYSESFAAVRELVSNGFDAVRAALALGAGGQSGVAVSPTDYELALTMERHGGHWWLVCRDTGIGMDREGIERHFLVAGSPLRRRVLDIARRSREAGSELSRSGEFGIGVLSYFMLADKVVVTTRELGGSEGGWTFEIEGLEGFGELRPEAAAAAGTTVRLRLKEDVFDDAEKWASQLSSYLRGTIVRTPCKLEVSLEPLESESFRAAPGWVAGQDWFARRLLRSLTVLGRDDRVLDLLPQESRDSAAENSADAAEVRRDALARLDWEVHEGELRDRLGSYRVSFPYWHLEGGDCRAYLRAGEEDDGLLLKPFRQRGSTSYAVAGDGVELVAWYGMSFSMAFPGLDVVQRQHVAMILEVDFASPRAGEIRLRRDQAALSDDARAAIAELRDEVTRISAGISMNLGPTAYRSLNMVVVGSSERVGPGDWQWAAEPGVGRPVPWRPIVFPCTSASHNLTIDRRPRVASICDEPVACVPDLGDRVESGEGGFPWHAGGIAPHRVVWCEDLAIPGDEPIVGIAPVWLGEPDSFSNALPYSADFPPEWESVCGAKWAVGGASAQSTFGREGSSMTVWNPACPLTSLADEDARKWAGRIFAPSDPSISSQWITALDPLAEKEALEDPSRAAAWVIRMISSQAGTPSELWTGIAERDGDFLAELWRTLGLEEAGKFEPLFFLNVENRYGSPYTIVDCIEPSGWSRSAMRTRSDCDFLPVPSEDWRMSLSVRQPVDSQA